MTTTDKNRFVAEKLGVPYSEYKTKGMDRKIHTHSDPAFHTDSGVVQLLRLMKDKDYIHKFSIQNDYPVLNGHYCIPFHLITAPGALLDAVWGFFGGKDE